MLVTMSDHELVALLPQPDPCLARRKEPEGKLCERGSLHLAILSVLRCMFSVAVELRQHNEVPLSAPQELQSIARSQPSGYSSQWLT